MGFNFRTSLIVVVLFMIWYIVTTYDWSVFIERFSDFCVSNYGMPLSLTLTFCYFNRDSLKLIFYRKSNDFSSYIIYSFVYLILFAAYWCIHSHYFGLGLNVVLEHLIELPILTNLVKLIFCVKVIKIIHRKSKPTLSDLAESLNLGCSIMPFYIPLMFIMYYNTRYMAFLDPCIQSRATAIFRAKLDTLVNKLHDNRRVYWYMPRISSLHGVLVHVPLLFIMIFLHSALLVYVKGAFKHSVNKGRWNFFAATIQTPSLD